MSALYCLGEVWLTLSPADPGSTLAQAELFHAQAGGSAAALCAGYVRRGGHAVLLTQLGEDAFGHRLKAALDQSGIDTSRIRFVSWQHTPVFFADSSEHIAYHGAESSFPPEEFDSAFLKDASALHFSSTGLLDGSTRYTYLKAILAARDSGIPVSFAPRLEPSLWADADFLRQTFFQYLPLADLVFLTESELEFLFGSPELRTALFSLFTGHVQFVGYVTPHETWLMTRNDLQRLEGTFSLETVCSGVLYQLMSSKLPPSGISRWNPKAMEISSFITSRPLTVPPRIS